MKAPTVASLKKVTPENLASLGVERLAEILCAAAEIRPELKRRLRMELAAEQGAEHLVAEIDKRLATLQTSRSRVSWRQRPTFVREVDGLRGLIEGRLAGLDRALALDRLWTFMALARRVGSRVKDKDGELAAVFDRAAGDIGALMAGDAPAAAARMLVAGMLKDPGGWIGWLPAVLGHASPALADAALRALAETEDAGPPVIALVRQLADVAGNVDAFRSTFSASALKTPAVAAEVARRLLAADRVEEAGALLKAAQAAAGKGWALGARPAEPDYDWEGAWIDYLDRSGQGGAAQAARWASFERTLSVERAREFTRRLADFDDVEAEGRAFDHAAAHADAPRALQFLMDWPALPEAARLILGRPEEIIVSPGQVEEWAARLRPRHPEAALVLLRKGAAAAYRRRDFKASKRLTQEADSIGA